MPYIKIKSGSLTTSNGLFGPGVHEVDNNDLEAIKASGLDWEEAKKGDTYAPDGRVTLNSGMSDTIATPTRQQVNQARAEAARHEKGRTSDHELKPLAETLGDFDDLDNASPTVEDALAFTATGGAFTTSDLAAKVTKVTTGEIAHQPRSTREEDVETQKARRELLEDNDKGVATPKEEADAKKGK